MFGWMIRNPYGAAVLVGLFVAIFFGWVSFPTEKTIEKRVTDWLPGSAAPAGSTRAELARVLEAVRAGDDGAYTRVSEEQFRDLTLPQTYGEPVPSSDERGFVIQYAGKEPSGQLYVAERRVFAGSWWSPDRLAYRAVEAEADQFGNVLKLTYERDFTGLLALLLMDAVVGGVYAAIVGMLLGILGSEGLDKKHRPKQLPNPAPMIPFNPRGGFRV